jgi:hypothetical protein
VTQVDSVLSTELYIMFFCVVEFFFRNVGYIMLLCAWCKLLDLKYKQVPSKVIILSTSSQPFGESPSLISKQGTYNM